MTETALLLEGLIAALILIGTFFVLTGSIGLVRFPDFFLRLHAPTKATTLGVGSLLLASATHFSVEAGVFRCPEILIMLFLFITSPVSAHFLAKAAMHVNVRSRPPLPSKRLDAPGWEEVPLPEHRRKPDQARV